MNPEQLKPAIEAVLFASGEPITVSRLSDALDLEPETAGKLADELAAEYEQRNSGIRVVRLGDSFQMCTHETFASEVRGALTLKRNTPLSQAALECLAVIAYNQPITRAFVTEVRGVDCSGVVATLAEKELIEERGRLDAPGHPLLYGTTANFLRCFGLKSLDDLPELPGAAGEEIPQQEEMLLQEAEV